MSASPVADKKPTVCFVSFSPIADDARVRRHGDALHEEGWSVVAVGLPGAKSHPPAWAVIDRVEEAASGADEIDLAGTQLPEVISEEAVEIPRPLSPSRQHLARRVAKFAYWRSRWVVGRVVGPPVRKARSTAGAFKGAVKGSVAPGTTTGRFARAAMRRATTAADILQMSSLRAAGVSRILPNVRTWREFIPYIRLLRAHVDREHALKIYWSWPSMQEMYEKARQVDADLWVANDWSTLPIIARIVEEKGGTYFYDSHEFATEEYPNNPHWVAFTKPIAKAVEEKFIRGSKRRFSVSPGIAKALNELYALNPPCEVLRNMPLRQDPTFRPTGDVVRVLYHGILSPERGLEAAIESIPFWRPEFHLTIRGPGNPAYVASLRKLIRKMGVNDRVTIAPPVPMIELVRAAKEFDVGFFALPDNSPHNKFALPNKFFEYVNSGLALCVTSCPDMAELVDRYNLGVLMPTTGPQDIAAVVNALDRDTIDSYKRNSIAASEELCWQAERMKLVRACNETLKLVG
ncbi:glycosyltransferase [Microvirga rosea]|uniref:glycosyltransferase n=1 Tax=Microvirga rosea TaxID=2715425 RepID=UPI001D0B8017|nr:glycosyltransferase [Microvirga rosea]MCB8820155.1 glycosyltransferase [Microvirga rosea]